MPLKNWVLRHGSLTDCTSNEWSLGVVLQLHLVQPRNPLAATEMCQEKEQRTEVA